MCHQRSRDDLAERLRNGRFCSRKLRLLSSCRRVQPGVPGRGAEELALLPEGSVIAEMLTDYAVVRDQLRILGEWHL